MVVFLSRSEASFKIKFLQKHPWADPSFISDQAVKIVKSVIPNYSWSFAEYSPLLLITAEYGFSKATMPYRLLG